MNLIITATIHFQLEYAKAGDTYLKKTFAFKINQLVLPCPK